MMPQFTSTSDPSPQQPETLFGQVADKFQQQNLSRDEIRTLSIANTKALRRFPSLAPKKNLEVIVLDHDVIGCEDAALAKQIPLKCELKTLVLDTSLGLVLAHTTGDKRISLRKIKRALQCDQAFLAAPATMESMNLHKGAICPLLEPLWSFLHLIDSSVLALEFVSTNYGTLNKYIKFSPKFLLEAPAQRVGEFSCD
jgi:prolyl-tRNA editing enzyme YbaK/EbsC (Cys-tRNA(Pro) deacylase)